MTEKSSAETVEVSDWAGEFIREFDTEQYLPDAVHPLFELLLQYPFIMVLLLLALGYLLGKLLQFLLRTGLGRLTKRTQSSLDDKLLKVLLSPVVPTTVLLSMVLAVKALNFPDAVQQVQIRFLVTLLIVFWARAWFKATSIALPVLSAEGSRFKVLQPRTVPLFEISIKLALVSIFIWLFMALWGIDGTAWLASAGVVGIAVGFAARDTLANLISGVSVVADAPYKIGDFIVLDSGERGIVTGLGMRSTRLLTRDDVEISIPNSVMGNAKITNECGGPVVQHRIRIPIGVAYGTDPSRVVTLLEEVALENPLIIDNPAPRVRMRAFGESALEFQLLGWINRSEQRGLATHELLMAINKRMREEGIVIPFPQRDLHVFSDKPDEPGPAGAKAVPDSHSVR